MLLIIFIAGFVLTQSTVSSDVGLDTKREETFENTKGSPVDSRDILQRLQKLETDGNKCLARLEELEIEMIQVNGKNRDLEFRMGTMKETVNSISTENKQLRSLNEELRNKIRHLERVTSSVNTRSQRASPASRASTVTQAQPLIAFYARAVAMLAHLGPGQTFIFDHVITNYGHAYDRRSGLFTAPVDGVYVFSATVMTASANNTYAGFAVNGHVVSTMLLSKFVGDNSSQQSILFLHKNDSISLKNVIYDRSYEGGDQTVFSGYLLSTASPPSLVPVG